MNKNLRNMGIGVVAVLLLLLILTVFADNHLKALDRQIQDQFAKVETAHQRQADLIPPMMQIIEKQNLHLQTKKMLDEVKALFAQHGKRVHMQDWSQLQKFESQTRDLNNDLIRLQMLADAYPKLKNDKNLNELKVLHQNIKRQIVEERGKIIALAEQYNKDLNRFPYILAKLFIGRGPKVVLNPN